MELRQVRALLTIAEEGSFTRAAGRLHMAQSGISIMVRSLEQELGVALFVRQHTGVTLTEQGRQAARLAEQMVGCADQLAGMSGRLASGEALLRVAYTPGVLRRLLPEVLATMHVQQPRIVVRVIEAPPAQIVSMLTSGDLDAAITCTEGTPAGTRAIPLANERLMVLVRRDSPQGGQRFLRLPQLATMPLLTFPPGHFMRQILDAAFREQGILPRIAFEVQRAHVIEEGVRQGLGVAVVAECFARDNACSDLLALPLKGRHLYRRIVLLYGRGQEDPAVESGRNAFVAAARGLFEGSGWASP